MIQKFYSGLWITYGKEADVKGTLNKGEVTIVAHSHLHPAAWDCGLYLQHRVLELRGTPFNVEPGSPGMWKLVFCANLDTINGKVGTQFTNNVVEQARAFIAGRGGMCMPLLSSPCEGRLMTESLEGGRLMPTKEIVERFQCDEFEDLLTTLTIEANRDLDARTVCDRKRACVDEIVAFCVKEVEKAGEAKR